MTLRVALSTLLLTLLCGCASMGDADAQRQAAGQAYVQLGLGYLQQGASGRAKVPLAKALALNPRDADAHAALALVFQREDEPALAESHFLKALAARPGDTRLLNNYGSFLYGQGRYAQASKMFAQAVDDTLYPERGRVFENLGLAAIRLGERDQAREHLQKALKLDHRQPRALLEMAELSYEDRHYVPARDYYERFSQLGDANARSLLLGSRLANVFDERNTALELGLQLQRLYPGTPEYQQYLSEQ